MAKRATERLIQGWFDSEVPSEKKVLDAFDYFFQSEGWKQKEVIGAGALALLGQEGAADLVKQVQSADTLISQRTLKHIVKLHSLIDRLSAIVSGSGLNSSIDTQVQEEMDSLRGDFGTIESSLGDRYREIGLDEDDA